MRSRTEVLLVENEPLIAANVTQKLHELGYRVSAVAARADEAYLSASACNPDLILMDINLDGPVDGIESANQIYTELGIPVVFLSADDNPKTLRRAQNTDPFGYVIKPVSSADLINSIEIALRHHRKRQLQQLRELWLETQLLSMGAGLIATTQDGTIQFINPEGERLLGLSKANVIGASFHSAVPLRNMLTGERADDLIRLAVVQRETIDIGDHYIIETPGESRRIAGELSIAKVGEEAVGLVFTFRDNTVEYGRASPLLSLLATAKEQDCSRIRINLNDTLYALKPTLEACLSPGSQLLVRADGDELPVVGNQTLVEALLFGLIQHAQSCSTKDIDVAISTVALDFVKRGLDGRTARYVRLKVVYRHRGSDRTPVFALPNMRRTESSFHKTRGALAGLRGTAQQIHSQGWVSWNFDLPRAPEVEGFAESVLPNLVVLIEPDVAVQTLLCNYLAEGNYDCLAAKNFQEARDWASSFPGQIDIVVVPEAEDPIEIQALLEETSNASLLLVTTETSIAIERRLNCSSARHVATIAPLFSKAMLRAKLDSMFTARVRNRLT